MGADPGSFRCEIRHGKMGLNRLAHARRDLVMARCFHTRTMARRESGRACWACARRFPGISDASTRSRCQPAYAAPIRSSRSRNQRAPAAADGRFPFRPRACHGAWPVPDAGAPLLSPPRTRRDCVCSEIPIQWRILFGAAMQDQTREGASMMGDGEACRRQHRREVCLRLGSLSSTGKPDFTTRPEARLHHSTGKPDFTTDAGKSAP